MKTIAVLLLSTVGGAVLAADGDVKGTALPLREVILYSSGVGYFERAGQIDGAGSVDLRFRTEEINDLLKSMVVQDHGGGTIGVISYDSRDPISKTLQSFAIDLTSNPSMRDILNQMRGEKIRVSWPAQTTGTVVGVEHRVIEEEKEKKREEDFLNLFANGTLQSIPFTQIREIRLENPRLQKDLEDALTTVAKGHDTEKKTVSLTFTGEGKREVDVSYIVEAPVWKTSYRLVLEEKGGFIQGWAIVENTGDEDWQNVQLSLVSGRPISFKMDLYQPLYAQRPVVQPELYLSLKPQLYQDNMQVERLADQQVVGLNGAALSASPAGPAGFAGGANFALGAPQAKDARLGRAFRGLNEGVAAKPFGFADAAAMASVAEGGITGELFQYALKMPVSIQRQKSAMLPIVTTKVEGGKLSIYNESVQAKHPLNGFRLKNTSDLHLMQGPITVFDGGSYAGDARIEDLAPGQERLISYAVDLPTEVDPVSKSQPETLVSVRIRHGTFSASKKLVEEKTYNVKNKDQKTKTVLIEHPLRADWKLETPSNPTERARDVYRFKLEVPAGKTESLLVRESRQVVEETALSSLDGGALSFYLRSDKVSDRVKDVLRKVASYRSDLAQLAAERKRRDDRLQEIGQEQTRIRENMARLSQTAELYQRYVKKFDEQETEFERLRGEAAKLKEQEAAKQRELNEYLDGLDLS
jgi:hypothetical protein